MKVKKELIIDVPTLTIGETSKEEWEQIVFPLFREQIKTHIGEEMQVKISGPFSTTTPSDLAAYDITLMASMKNYFTYKMRTKCGIPSIELCGTEEDWVSLKDRAIGLFEDLMPDYLTILTPVLEQFIKAYNGKVKYQFWQTIGKKVQHGKGSGSYKTVSGWVQLLYPYLKGEKNEHLKPWKNLSGKKGPEPDEFPIVVSSAPVIWEYLGKTFRLHFHAGVFGTVQDKDTKALSSLVGWIVTRDKEEDKETGES